MPSAKSLFLNVFSAFFLLTSTHLLAVEAKKAPVGMVLSLKGEAVIISPDGSRRQAKLKSPVYVGDRIETKFQSFVQVNFLDRSKISLAGSSDFTVQDYYYDAKKNQARSELKVENGALKFMAGKIAKIAPQNYKIHTTTATIGIRGSSGELMTSNGKLPGVPQGLQLMKTGGKGIMATLPGATQPLPDITSSGKGLMIDPGGKVSQNVKFSGSLVANYTKKTEKRIATAKTKAKKQEKAKAKAAKKGGDSAKRELREEKKSEKAQVGDTQKEGQEEQNSEEPAPKEEHDKKSAAKDGEPKKERRDRMMAHGPDDQQEPDEHEANEGRDDKMANNRRGPRPGRERSGRGFERQQRRMGDRGDSANLAAYEGGGEGHEAPPMEQMGDTAGLEPYFEGMDGHEPPMFDPEYQSMEFEGDFDFAAFTELSNDLSDLVVGTIEEPTEYYAPEDEQSTTTPPPQIVNTYTGVGVSLFGDANTLSGYSRTISVDSYDQGADQIIHRDNDGTYFGMPSHLPNSNGADRIYEDTPNDSDLLWQREYSHDGDFTLVNRYEESNGETLELMAYGTPSTVATTPNSGIAFFSSDSDRDYNSDASGDNGEMVGSILVRNNQVLNPGFSNSSAVDYGSGKMVGMTSNMMLHDGHHSDNQGSFDYSDENYVNDDHFDKRRSDFAQTLYFGDVGDDGSITNVKFYSNLGFQPSHVKLPGLLTQTSPTYGMQFNTLDTLTGSGHLFGNNQDGLAITGADANTQFIAAGFREIGEQPESTPDGTFTGSGRGLRASGTGFTSVQSANLSNLSLAATFSANQVTGGMNLDNGYNMAVTLGSDNAALEREFIAATLQGSDGNGNDIVNGTSFIVAADLPEMMDINGYHQTPTDVMWGTWNIVEENSINEPIIYPGQHNFWVAGTATVINAGGADTAAKLNLTGNRHVYRGGIMQSFVQPNGMTGMMLDQLWDVPEFGDDPNNASYTPTAITGSGPMVHSEQGSLTVGFDFSTSEVRILGRMPDGTVLIGKGGTDSATENGFSTDITIFSTEGFNDGTNGIISNAVASATALVGRHVGPNAESLILDYGQDGANTGDPFAYGVGIAGHQDSGTISNDGYSGTAHGVWIDETSGTAVVRHLDGPALAVVMNTDPNNFASTGTITLGASGQVLEFTQDSVNTFIDKDSFFSKINPTTGTGTMVTLDNVAGSRPLDPDNSFILSMPGLENFEHITWGIWGSKDSGADERAYGYFGIGRRNQGGTSDLIPDFSALSARPDPVVTYTGVTTGTIFDSGGAYNAFGSASVSVNFNSGAVTGNLNLGPEQVGLNGLIDQATAGFSGSATLNGGGNGTFGGGFYADEMAGSYGASNGTKAVTGAFGAKADDSIPQVQMNP